MSRDCRRPDRWSGPLAPLGGVGSGGHCDGVIGIVEVVGMEPFSLRRPLPGDGAGDGREHRPSRPAEWTPTAGQPERLRRCYINLTTMR